MIHAVVSGDPLLTNCQTLVFAYNAAGRSELGLLESRLFTQYPPAFSSYRKYCRSGRAHPGTIWLWRESLPKLAFLLARQTPFSAYRLRFVQSAALVLARDYWREGITSAALAPFGTPQDWPEIKQIFTQWLAPSALPVVLYDEYVPGVRAEDSLVY